MRGNTQPPYDNRSFFGMVLGTIFWTAVLFFAALFCSGCTSIKIKRNNYPCCNKEVCEVRYILSANGVHHVFHRDSTGAELIKIIKQK